MALLYFAFANDDKRPLPSLQQEAREIDRMLRPLDQQGAFKLIIDYFATLPEVMRKLALYENELSLFHFSGHAESNLLQMEDGVSYAAGISAQLGRCRQLQLVVLNGCKTEEQVKLLHALSIPAVIATPFEVDDRKALQFSQAFYESLSYFLPLSDAFAHGTNRIKALDEKAEVHRGARLKEAPVYQPSTWELTLLDGEERHAQWRLPDDRGAQSGPDNFVPNNILIETLAESIAPFNDKLQGLLNNEAMGLHVEIFEKREAIVECLPHPIGDGIRKLVAQPTDADKGKQEFYDRLDGNRLRQLVLVFEIVAELLTFILLAQLWEEMDPEETTSPDKRPPLRLAPEDVKQVMEFLEQAELNLEKNLLLILHLQQIFEQKQIPSFIQELSGFKALYQEGKPFYEACNWLCRLHQRLALEPPTEQQGRSLCRMAEEQLCIVLREMGFLVRYTFASVKNIDLIKYRHPRQPIYQHRLVSLVMNITGLGERSVPLQRYFDSRSVLLLNGNPEKPESIKGELNLTPFVVDENAFNPDARLAKLHFFRRRLPGGIYAYRFIYLLDDLPLVLNPNDPPTKFMQRILHMQFQHFEKLLNTQSAA